ncbi:hypothetical protein ACFX2G_042778 [Malus domestica]
MTRTIMFYGVSTRLELPNHMAKDTPSAKPKSPGKSPPLSRSSTLMKPTASQLAKQNHCRKVPSNRLLRRVAKKLGKLDEKSQNSPPPTKRQKLEAGYVRNVAEQLEHQPLWLNKVPKKVRADAARPEVNVPKEPNLETENRALRRRFTGLLHGLARKRAQFQQQSFRPNSVYALKQEKSGMVYKCVACSLKNKELKFAIDKRCLKEPPTDSFSKVGAISKLSLGSEEQHNTKPQSKSAFAC